MRKNEIKIKLSEKTLDKDTGVRVNIDEIPSSKYHCHEFIEVCYCQVGSGKQIIDGETVDISEGDIFLFNEDVYHRLLKGKDRMKVVNVMFRASLFTGQSGKNFVEDFFTNVFNGEKGSIFKNLKYLYVGGRKSNANYGIQFLDMLNEYNYLQPDYVRILYSEIELLLLNIGRDYIIKNKLFGVSMENEKVIQTVIDKINHTPMKNVNTIEDVLEDVAFNITYFNRIFKRYMGISLSKYIKQKKMEYACTLLMETDLTVEDISEEVGYSDVKNFYRVFKERMNQTPGAFRYKIKNPKQ